MKKCTISLILTVIGALTLGGACCYSEAASTTVGKKKKEQKEQKQSSEATTLQEPVVAPDPATQVRARIDILVAHIRTDSLQLIDLTGRRKLTRDSIDARKDDIILQDGALLSIAARFLYLPYNEELIQKIALPAFDAVTTEGAKEDYEIIRTLLVNQQAYIDELYAFLDNADKEYSKKRIAFGGPNLDVTSKTFQELRVYKDYTQYADWQNTYLGKFLLRVDETIKKIDRLHKPNVFPPLIKELGAMSFKINQPNPQNP